MNDVASKIEEIEKGYGDKMAELAEQYRKKVLIPFCKKYGLLFGNGMGSHFFFVRTPKFEAINIFDCEANDIPDFVPKKLFLN